MIPLYQVTLKPLSKTAARRRVDRLERNYRLATPVDFPDSAQWIAIYKANRDAGADPALLHAWLTDKMQQLVLTTDANHGS